MNATTSLSELQRYKRAANAMSVRDRAALMRDVKQMTKANIRLTITDLADFAEAKAAARKV